MGGLKTVENIYAEQTGMKRSVLSPEKYVDQSYLKQALKEVGGDNARLLRQTGFV